MANPSRPFQSRVMTHVVKLYHHLTTKGARWARHCQSTTRWWTQVALYPAYAVLQATRTAFQKVQDFTAQVRNRLGLGPYHSQSLEESSPLPADWGIQQVLSAVLPSTAIKNSEALAHPVAAQPALWEGHDGELGELQVKPQQLPTGRQIQGLASCLENHSLVLVGTDNQIVACLSAEQQAAIATLISQLMAAYDRWQRQQHHLGLDQTGAVVSARTWWPVRFVAWLLAWMQSGMAHSSVNELSASESGEQLPPQASLNGQPSDRSLPPQFWSQPLALLQEKLGDRPWIQQGLQAFQSIQSRLKSAGESLVLRLPAVPSRLQSPPVQTNSGLMAPLNLGSWPRSSQALLQSLMPWLGSPTGQLTPVGSGEMSEALMSVSMTATGDAIAAPKTDDYSADWINAEVLTTEYLERPFRRLLRWLDQLLLWLEKRLVGCWEWLRSLFSSMR
ncbi:MAG: hypothetical protein F6K00_27730 [Leptolyngbya sp. SIOISBB]|nr:hypothetical protein [Leptolyngbya sp. SIOISBB]